MQRRRGPLARVLISVPLSVLLTPCSSVPGRSHVTNAHCWVPHCSARRGKLLSHVRLFSRLFSVRGILQARILQWGAIPFSLGIFLTQGSNPVSCITGRVFTI